MAVSADTLRAEAHTESEAVLSRLAAAADNVAVAEGKRAAAAVHRDDDPVLDAAAVAGHVVVNQYVLPAVPSHTACAQAAVCHNVVRAGRQLGVVWEWHSEALHTADAAVLAAVPADTAVQLVADSQAREYLTTHKRHHHL